MPPASSSRRRTGSSPVTRRLAAAVGVVCALAVFCAAAGAARRAPAPQVPGEQSVAIIFATHVAFRAPNLDAPAAARVVTRTPITGERTTLPVLARRTVQGTRWLRVMLPGRPNGNSGWIRERMTQLSVTPWRLIVDLRARTVSVYLAGRRQRVFRAVVGKPSTPTPTGHFFVQETVKMPVGDPGGPYALALSARSDVLQEFDGGPGQIAIHGRDDLGGTLGAAQSHGCVRLADSAISYLARWIGPGVPVNIFSS